MHNKQPFSVAKKIKLFKCMNEVKKICVGIKIWKKVLEVCNIST